MAQPQSAPERRPPAVDARIVSQLQSLEEEGEISFFANRVQEFAAEGARLLTTIHQAVEAGDAVLLRNSAHSLKGSSASMGATRLAALCKEAEAFGRESETTGARSLLPTLQAEWELLQDDLRKYLRE